MSESKYAPCPGCVTCAAIDALCVNCAMEWQARHVDGELRILRRIAAMAATIPGYPGITSALVKLRHHRRQKPPRKLKGRSR